MRAFSPSATTVNIDVSSSSQRVQVVPARSNQDVRVKNSGSADAFIVMGDSTVTASLTTSMPIGAGVTEVLNLGGHTYVAAIAAGSTGKIYLTPGNGI